MFKRFESSGQVGSMSMILAPLFVVPTIVAVGYGYVLLTHWVSIVYANALFALLYGLAVGASLQYAFKFGHCRSPKLAMICGGLAGAVAFCVSLWEAYPTQEALMFRYQNGWQILSHHGDQNGAPMPALIVWGLELVLLISISAFVAKQGLNSAYCEDCQRWLDKPEDSLFNRVEPRYEDTPVIEAAKQHDMPKLLRALERGRGQGTLSLILDIRRCGSCEGASYLTVKCKSEKGGKYGKDAVTKTLVDQVEVSEEEVNAIKSIFGAQANIQV
jgi:hypothetical protein